jgi:hypothetical protein
MEFPVHLSTIGHHHGGKITCIYGCSHAIDKPQDGHSRDHWFFIADVQWSDGTKSEKTEVPPYALCCDDLGKNPEIDGLMSAMNEYLSANGEWFDTGKHQGWYANRKTKLGPVFDSTGRLMASVGPLAA